MLLHNVKHYKILFFHVDRKPALRPNAVPRIFTGPGVPAYFFWIEDFIEINKRQ